MASLPGSAGTASLGAPAAAAAPHARSGLLSLSLDLLELVCQPLTVLDRVAVTSCSRRLWAHPGVLASRALWDDMNLRPVHRHMRPQAVRPARLTLSLCAWLERRRPALTRLRISGYLEMQGLVLNSLCGGALQHLALCSNPAVGAGRHCSIMLPALTGLTTLTSLHLVRCELGRWLPDSLSALSRLQDLSLEGNGAAEWSSEEEAVEWEEEEEEGEEEDGLPILPAQQMQPPALPAQPQQQQPPPPPQQQPPRLLWLYESAHRRWQHTGFSPLRTLRALTALDLRACALVVVPEQVGMLPALRKLQLDCNPFLGQYLPGTFEPLAAATALTELSMRSCGLYSLPSQLASMPALRTLLLSGNPLPPTVHRGGLRRLPGAVSLDIDVPDREGSAAAS